ncbi:MAG: 16S rRNA (guanine(966)-N(2))-methyltransferase RsmD [Gammaproteobacteria bacterium RIFCSPHIGHO2_12_FULL_35_23]|nr:MAG: 16S rRNA (guanine(966)-N(2))-methyltransferase RsmD [Gammaproteobacteria bacterium RIFCSPHIGHO2_12_FULL_35_23]
MLTNQVRIIAGRWRGRKLKFPTVQGLRPTSDRLRETLFNWLRVKIDQAICLDAFAGSGALGFEALSQGASKSIMLDNTSAVVKQLKENATLLAADNAEIYQIDTFTYLKTCQQRFDLIFLDPPFNSDYLLKALNLIVQRKLLAEEGTIYIERSRKMESALGDNWQIIKEKSLGEVTAALITYRNQAPF